jgi:hypothetical protein
VVGGPVLAAAVGFVTGLPARLTLTGLALIGLAAAAVADPVTAAWLAALAITAICAFILGALRKAPPGFYQVLGHTPPGRQIGRLHRQLVAEHARADQAEAIVADLLATVPAPRRALLARTGPPR